MIKEELKNIRLNQRCLNEAHNLLKNAILKTAKANIGKDQVVDNILDHAQIRQKRTKKTF